MLLFRELQRSGNDKCFKCSEPIQDIDHLSIEHKQPWLDVDPSLYWELDNIEFSHLTCNRPHRYNTSYVGPEGTSWCVGHQSFVPLTEFWNNTTRPNGKQHYCKTCRGKGGVADSHKARGRGAAVVAGGS